MDTKGNYDLIAEEWHKDHQSDTWWVEGTDAFASFLPSGARVLDVGCGGGTKAKYLINKGFFVVGIDFSENMIAIAKREVPKGEFHVLDMYEVDSLGQTFDGIFMQASLLHIRKRDALHALERVSSTLQPGGHLYVAVKEQQPGKPEEEIKEKIEYGYQFNQFFSYFTLDEIKGYLTSLGFVIRYETVTASELSSTRWVQVVGQKK